MESMLSLAEDVSDPPSEKAAFIFLNRGVTMWGQSSSVPAATVPNGTHSEESRDAVPGFERWIYERLVPAVFHIPSLPEFNLKDGQIMTVCHLTLHRTIAPLIVPEGPS